MFVKRRVRWPSTLSHCHILFLISYILSKAPTATNSHTNTQLLPVSMSSTIILWVTLYWRTFLRPTFMAWWLKRWLNTQSQKPGLAGCHLIRYRYSRRDMKGTKVSQRCVMKCQGLFWKQMELNPANHQNTKKVSYSPSSTSQYWLTWIWTIRLEMKQLCIQIHLGLMPIISIKLLFQKYVNNTKWRR